MLAKVACILAAIALVFGILAFAHPITSTIGGPQGPKGDTGAIGPQGIQGQQGKSGILWDSGYSVSRGFQYYWGAGVGYPILLNSGDRVTFTVYGDHPVRCYVTDPFGNHILQCVGETSGGPCNSAGAIIAASNGTYDINMDSPTDMFSYSSQILVTGTLNYTVYTNLNS